MLCEVPFLPVRTPSRYAKTPRTSGSTSSDANLPQMLPPTLCSGHSSIQNIEVLQGSLMLFQMLSQISTHLSYVCSGLYSLCMVSDKPQIAYLTLGLDPW